MLILLSIVVLILSIILHEVAHGYVADWLGDPTARYSGRLTLNPLPHIDPIGSVILPGILLLSHSPFVIGWAKPVPYNPYNISNRRWGEALVAGAGPLTNILLALVLGQLVHFAAPLGLSSDFLFLCAKAVQVNLVLAIYNLIPIPPLDGSKVLRALLPYEGRMAFARLEQSAYALGPVGLIAVSLVAIYLLWPLIAGLVDTLFALMTAL
jgi:Zn-dependent protease